MARTTIDFGIDLGTTNSSIAVISGAGTEVVKNLVHAEYTPSAVYVDKKGAMFVGQKAKERWMNDDENGFCEFKLQMGTGHEHVIARTGQRMRAEELSAEVLKSLKANVKHRMDEDLQAAVITVPAAFELPQCDATQKAAQLAGITLSPLLQEPVAAALAYGFQSESDKVVWLVYDIGGGTFDAAVIQIRDGVIQVINHGGDNHLGGKMIDWEIVEKILVPAVVKEFGVSNFNRGNKRWSAAFAKLKGEAEKAKILLSSDKSTSILVENLFNNCAEFTGGSVDLELDLERNEIEPLIEPILERSLNICRRVLSEKRMATDQIEKVLLVGGPTLTPWLRQRLGDSQAGLGIRLEFSIDPITVVARGAAIFASTQRLEGTVPSRVGAGQYSIELRYEAVGDVEPLVGGRVSSGSAESLDGHKIEFANPEARPSWRSGKIALSPDGTFITSLLAEKGRQNTFTIELFSPSGTTLDLSPDKLTYTVGVVFTDPLLTHSLGVQLANNEMACFFEKGRSLPARQMLRDFRTVVALARGQAGHLLRIPVMEGESLKRADRNTLIGSLDISAKAIKRDIPVGSEVEVTIEIDKSRLVRVKAFVPIIDEEFETIISYINYQIQAKDERRIQDVESSLVAASGDRDEADKCLNRLLEIKRAIDNVEDAIKWPALMARAEEEIEIERNLTTDDQYDATTEEKSLFAMLEREIRAAMDSRDPELLEGKIDKMDSLGYRIVQRQSSWWVAQFDHLEKRKQSMNEPGKAEAYFTQGRRAISNNDLESLKAAIRQLWSMLPAGEPSSVKSISGLIR
jgi:molecular chaperone DnaK